MSGLTLRKHAEGLSENAQSSFWFLVRTLGRAHGECVCVCLEIPDCFGGPLRGGKERYFYVVFF